MTDPEVKDLIQLFDRYIAMRRKAHPLRSGKVETGSMELTPDEIAFRGIEETVITAIAKARDKLKTKRPVIT